MKKFDTLLVSLGYNKMAFVGLSGQEISQLSHLLEKLVPTDDRWDGSDYLPVIEAGKKVGIQLISSQNLLTQEQFQVVEDRMKAEREAREAAKTEVQEAD